MRGAAALALLLVAGCSPAAPASNNAEAVIANAALGTPLSVGDAALSQWLIGHWAEGEDCALDFTVTYHEGGKLEASYRTGTWRIERGTLVETITSRRTDDDPATRTIYDDPATLSVDPPDTERYTIEKRSEDRAILRNGKKMQPIRRC
jgi:hypothetical protein